ncbi:MAG TPA: LytTR family DNA-binding domain-containing protein [Gemmatimonadaceae bacterium]|nr:LytTR family DNA-binding domain-containing protein [Gemmatimonadaceae bacterium]
MTVAKPLRVLIADDERLARQRLEDLLRHEDNVEIVGRTENGLATIAAVRELEPDIVFLDIQMPGKTGLEVIREIGPEDMPPVIFTTAYDHAVAAFDLAAIDYLIKPFDDERFEKAFRRALKMIELNQVSKLSDELRTLLRAGAGDSGAGKSQYLERIAVEMRGQVRVVPVKQIDYMVASGPYAELYVGDKRYLIRERMQTLEERLDPAKFFRIHRSAIVRLDLIETLIKNPGGDYGIQLKGGVKLKVSRSRFESLESLLGVKI